MPRETHVLIYAESRLHAQAWGAPLRDEPFLDVQAIATGTQSLHDWGFNGPGWALLVDLEQPSGSDVAHIREWASGTEAALWAGHNGYGEGQP